MGYLWTRLQGGGWAEFAEKANRLSAIQQKLHILQGQQAANAKAYTLLTEEAAYIRRGLI